MTPRAAVPIGSAYVVAVRDEVLHAVPPMGLFSKQRKPFGWRRRFDAVCGAHVRQLMVTDSLHPEMVMVGIWPPRRVPGFVRCQECVERAVPKRPPSGRHLYFAVPS